MVVVLSCDVCMCQVIGGEDVGLWFCCWFCCSNVFCTDHQFKLEEKRLHVVPGDNELFESAHQESQNSRILLKI